IMLLGLGKRDKFSDEVARTCAGRAALKAKELGLKEFSLLQFSNLDEGLIESITEGLCLSLYSFDKYKSGSEKDSPAPQSKLEEVTVLINSDSPRFQSVADRAASIAEAVNFSRDLANLPPNDCAPSYLASTTLSMAAEY